MNDNNKKELIIIRGLPGSGKTKLAKSLVKDGVIHSTDNFFYNEHGNYDFDVGKIGYYHFLNFVEALKSMKAGISTVIIDNTNVMAKHCKNYVDAGRNYGYKISVVETQTAWRFDVDELVKRNVHQVTRDSIEKMITEYEPIEVFKRKLGIECKRGVG